MNKKEKAEKVVLSTLVHEVFCRDTLHIVKKKKKNWQSVPYYHQNQQLFQSFEACVQPFCLCRGW